MNPWQKVKLFLSLKETWTRIEKYWEVVKCVSSRWCKWSETDETSIIEKLKLY